MLFVAVDIPICRDFILYDETKLGRRMTYVELVAYLKHEFGFADFRIHVILETLGRYPDKQGL